VRGPENMASKPWAWVAFSVASSAVNTWPGRHGEVAAVYDGLVEGHQAADLAGHLDRAGLRRAGPGGRVPPCRRQCDDVGDDAVTPAGLQSGRVTRRSVVRQVGGLHRRRPREGLGQRADVIEQVADAVGCARVGAMRRSSGWTRTRSAICCAAGAKIDRHGGVDSLRPRRRNLAHRRRLTHPVGAGRAVSPTRARAIVMVRSCAMRWQVPAGSTHRSSVRRWRH
jgi:hypothetical protein